MKCPPSGRPFDAGHGLPSTLLGTGWPWAPQRGAILITTLIILSFLAGMGLSLTTYIASRRERATLELERLQAFYLAEAGLAKALNEMRVDTDFDDNGVGNVAWVKLGKGRYRARHNFQAATITGMGLFRGVRRTIQISYGAL